ncbi:MAG: hypothetical protein IT443_03005 [Phycisphaeraceae bacterium]|nr:hypothetical protein [Phycisphaeraceae bacterium]
MSFTALLPVILSTTLLAAPGVPQFPPAGPATPPAPARPRPAADEAPAARAYLQTWEETLKRMESTLPAITAAAQLALDPLLDGATLQTFGDPTLEAELGNRPGSLDLFPDPDAAVQASKPRRPPVVIYALGLARGNDPAPADLIQKQLHNARQLRDRGSIVVAIASLAQLRDLNLVEQAEQSVSALLDNCVPADDRAYAGQAKGRLPSLAPLADAVTAWLFELELYAASVRQNSPLPIYRLPKKAPHADARPAPVQAPTSQPASELPPGFLSRAYLHAVHQTLRDLGTTSWIDLARTARRASGTLVDGHRVFVVTIPAFPAASLRYPLTNEPSLYLRLDAATKEEDGPTDDDFALALGTDETPGSADWGCPELIRQAGRPACWVTAAAGREAGNRFLQRREIRLDPCWPYGDRLVRLPGSPKALAPASGLFAQTILNLISAQVEADLRNAPRPRPRK